MHRFHFGCVSLLEFSRVEQTLPDLQIVLFHADQFFRGIFPVHRRPPDRSADRGSVRGSVVIYSREKRLSNGRKSRKKSVLRLLFSGFCARLSKEKTEWKTENHAARPQSDTKQRNSCAGKCAGGLSAGRRALRMRDVHHAAVRADHALFHLLRHGGFDLLSETASLGVCGRRGTLRRALFRLQENFRLESLVSHRHLRSAADCRFLFSRGQRSAPLDQGPRDRQHSALGILQSDSDAVPGKIPFGADPVHRTGAVLAGVCGGGMYLRTRDFLCSAGPRSRDNVSSDDPVLRHDVHCGNHVEDSSSDSAGDGGRRFFLCDGV